MSPDSAVNSVGCDKEIPVHAQRLNVANFRTKVNRDTELCCPCLQNFQQTNTSDAGEAVAVNRDLVSAVNNVDIVPRLKVPRYFGVRFSVGFAQVRKCLTRKNNAPTKGVIRSIAFIDSDLMRSVCLLHKDCQIEAGWTTSDDVDLHAHK